MRKLKKDETLFNNAVALEYDYVPKLVPFREAEQKAIVTAIKPLFKGINGRNIAVTGHGEFKREAVMAVMHVLEEEIKYVLTFFVDCNNQDSKHIMMELCSQAGLTQVSDTDALFDAFVIALDNGPAVFLFERVELATDLDFLYSILNQIPLKIVIIMVTFNEFLSELDNRIKALLNPDILEFSHYSYEETKSILEQRKELAFNKDVWADSIVEPIYKKAFELHDIRMGLYLMKEAAYAAEDDESTIVKKKHVDIGLRKLEDFTEKAQRSLDMKAKKVMRDAGVRRIKGF